MDSAKKRSIIQSTTGYTAANSLAQGIGMINSIVLRGFMGPRAMGVWSLLQVILGYCGYASFGTTKALARDYPYFRARGENEKADELKDLTLTFSLAMSLIPAALLSVYLGFRGRGLEPALRFGLGFLVVFLFIQRFYDLVVNLLRSEKKFGVLSQLLVLNAVGGLVISFLLVSRWNIYGLLGGTALVTLGCLWFIYRRNPYRFRYYWNSRELVKELKLGIPLVISGFLFEFLKSLDKWMLAKGLGFYEVGLYSIAMMVNSYVYSLPMTFAHIWYPHLQEAYGEGESAAAVKGYLVTPVFILSVLVPFLSGLAIFIAPVLTELLLPKFTAGIGAMKIYLAGTYFLMLAQFSRDFLVRLDKYWLNIGVAISAIGVNFFSNLLFLKLGWGLEGIAAGTAISFLFCGLTSFVLAARNFAKGKEWISYTSKLIALFSSFFGGILLIDKGIQLDHWLGEFVLKVVLFLGFSIPYFWVLERQSGLMKLFFQVLSKQRTG